ncbi:ANTAR domain-containing protein [Actinomycetospora sp. CA-101289]|uniref:ANTAR domain-containing protein n=1 Tax=Actinomycetospora sp. CA-101289 TaxID=3239893 RepID=UPI003D98E28B
MADPRQELVELIDLVEEVASHVEALEETDDTDAPPPVAGPSPAASEERAVRAAGARFAGQRAREMREGLDRIRAHAQRVADQARRSGVAAREAARGGQPGPTVWAGTPWPAVEQAGRRLAGLSVDTGDVPCDQVVEIVRDALATARHVGLATPDEHGRAVLLAGDHALREVLEDEAAGDGPVRAALHGTAPVEPTVHPGLGSVLVLPLVPVADGRPEDRPRPMALVLAAPEQDGIDAVTARLVAVQVSVLLCGARRVAGLHRALESRDLIGQAKGIVMQRDGVDAQTAFRVLAQASQHANLKLTSVAQWLVAEIAAREGAGC